MSNPLPSITTDISVCLAASSGSRYCLVCEEEIDDRTVIIDFQTVIGNRRIERECTQLSLHVACAEKLSAEISSLMSSLRGAA